MIELKLLNDKCLKRVDEYQNIDIHGTKVNVPYFINNVEGFFVDLMRQSEVTEESILKLKDLFQKKTIPYAWERGKGTPEQIQESTLKISETVGLPLQDADEDTILEFMKLYGIGVDCSGLVYNILSDAFSSFNDTLFEDSLDWQDKTKKGANRAGVFIFAGDASVLIDPKDVHKLDLVLIKSRRSQKYVHIGMILEKNNSLILVQSTITVSPSGVNISNFDTNENNPIFSFKPKIGRDWIEGYKDGLVEFRRLKIIEDSI